MSYKPENDPTSPEAVKMCEQAADSYISAPKQFLLTLDVERDKLSTEDCDSVLEKFNFSRDFNNEKLPESTYLGTIPESEDTSNLFDKIMQVLQEKCESAVTISVCGGFVENFKQKHS